MANKDNAPKFYTKPSYPMTQNQNQYDSIS